MKNSHTRILEKEPFVLKPNQRKLQCIEKRLQQNLKTETIQKYHKRPDCMSEDLNLLLVEKKKPESPKKPQPEPPKSFESQFVFHKKKLTDYNASLAGLQKEIETNRR
jgi:hypothetical protein